MDAKQGYKTTEFWLTIATSIFSALVLANVLTQEEAAAWMAIFAPVIGLIIPVMVYTISRAVVKSK